MSNKDFDDKHELQSLVKAQEQKIIELTEKLEVAKEVVDSVLLYETKKPSFEFYRKRHLALEKYRKLIKD